MCGLAGFLKREPSSSEEELKSTLSAMASRIRNRGPDDEGQWVDPIAGVALGFRRLAIVDLSSEGHQPMLSESGRYVIVFNGEVYNFPELREELAGFGHRFRGHSDTEVMLAAVSRWGVEAAVQRFGGMFAFALWDRQERRLWLARDRFGKKPLYFGWIGSTFVFGSELKALREHPCFRGEVDRSAVGLLLQFGYIPSPASIYRGIRKLTPGTMLMVDAGLAESEPRPYWSAHASALAGQRDQFRGSDAEAVAELDLLVRDSVRMRMIADVPLGAFLSGGIDSSLVVALMAAQSTAAVKTFSIGFHEAEYNEAHYAKRVATHLGTEHTEFYVSSNDALDIVPRLPEMYDEPFGDPSQIPMFLLSQLARRHVTVALSGDGGDELFAGYRRYFLARKLWRGIGWMPSAVRNAAGALLKGPFGKFPAATKYADKWQKAGDLFSITSADELYARIVYHWKDGFTVAGGERVQTSLERPEEIEEIDGSMPRMMYLDSVTYLPDDILVKVDRATMAASLEGRSPLLDTRVYDFAWRLPMRMKVRNGQGKWILREVLRQYLPDDLIERPKMGFAVPIGRWLRGPLRGWAEELLDPKRLAREGFLAPAPIRAKWEQHLRGERDWKYHLWDVLMFQAWLEHVR